MSITIGNTSASTAQADQSTFSWNHVVEAGCTALIVCVGARNDGGAVPTVNSVTFNSVALTKDKQQNGSDYTAQVWRINGPAAGTHAVAVTFSASVGASAAGGLSLLGADGSASNVTGGTNAGSGNPSTAVTTTVAGCYAVDCFYSGLSSNLTVGAGQTQIFQTAVTDVNADRVGASYELKAAAGSVTMSWTGDDGWAQAVSAYAPSVDFNGVVMFI